MLKNKILSFTLAERRLHAEFIIEGMTYKIMGLSMKYNWVGYNLTKGEYLRDDARESIVFETKSDLLHSIDAIHNKEIK